MKTLISILALVFAVTACTAGTPTPAGPGTHEAAPTERPTPAPTPSPAIAATPSPAATAAPVTSRTKRVPAIPKKATTAKQAGNNIGKTKTVCGKVATATYAKSTTGRPTYLNLDKPYPRQIFTILIWSEYRSLYKRAPEKLFRGKTVCVRGPISTYNGTPQIIARGSKVWIPKQKTVTVSKPSKATAKSSTSSRSGAVSGYDDYDYSDAWIDAAIEADIDRMMDDYDDWLDSRLDEFFD